MKLVYLLTIKSNESNTWNGEIHRQMSHDLGFTVTPPPPKVKKKIAMCVLLYIPVYTISTYETPYREEMEK